MEIPMVRQSFPKLWPRPEGSGGIRGLARVYAPVFQHVPDFLKSTEYKVPMDVRNGPFQQVVAKPGEWELLVLHATTVSRLSGSFLARSSWGYAEDDRNISWLGID